MSSVSGAAAVLFFFFSTVTLSEPKFTIEPTGPVVVHQVEQFTETKLVLTCNSTWEENISQLIWEIPTLHFAELANQNDFNTLLAARKTVNDLPSRIKISSYINSWNNGTVRLFALSTLTIWNLTIWDEGYYTCRSINEQGEIITSSRLYIFPFAEKRLRTSTRPLFKGMKTEAATYNIRDIDPLRSFYVVKEKSSLIIPCMPHVFRDINPGDYQRWSLLQRWDSEARKWQKISQEVNKNQIWIWMDKNLNKSGNKSLITTPKIYAGFELFFTEKGTIKFGVYRYIFRHRDGLREVSEPFSILVEVNSPHNETCDNSKPIIRPSVKYLVFQPGSTFNLTCEINDSNAGNNFTWQPPESRNPPSDGKKVSSSMQTWARSKNGLTLTVPNATYADTGYYTCQNLENYKLHTKQYVFIQDLTVLMTFTFRPYREDQSLSGSPFFYLPSSNEATMTERPTTIKRVIIVALHSSPVAVRIIPTSPLVDMILYRIVPSGGRLQIYPLPTDGLNTINKGYNSWSYDIFEGFRNSNSTWDMVGNYQVEGSYAREFAIYDDPLVISDNMDRRQFNLQFSIYVEGMEIVPSEPRAIEGKSFSLKCRWKYPRHVDPSWDVWSWWHQRDRIDEIDWIWSATSQVNSSSSEELSYHNFSSKLGAQEVGWINSRMRPVPFQGFYESTLTIKNVTREASSGRFRCTFRYKRENGNQGYFAAAYEMNVLEGRATKSLGSNLNNSTSNTGTTNCTSVIGISILVVVILMGFLLGSIYLSKRWEKFVQVNREQLLLVSDSLERINSEIPLLEEQTRLLLNYPRWEFPRDRIILGKELGCGQFGVVVQASQIGSVHDPKDYRVRTVAVKMIKSTFNPASLKSLVSELKILIHLGPHINVVNLLGACTRNILTGELLIIEEFCMYGSIKDYLIANRDSFIVNELDERIFGKLKNYGNLLVKTYKDEHQNREQYRYRMDELGSSSYFSNRPNRNDEEQVALLFDDSNEYLMGSRKEEASPTLKNGGGITTLDLIYWSLQIASGMNHLANKKVIHGDLAARNVLLTAGNVVKIADFGLSRQTNYSEGIYFGKREEALPVKWMAIESLTDRILTTQSDVWSYGIVLWELFSLGEMPYAEVTTLEDLIRFLWSGERLKQPPLMPKSIAAVMAKCWKDDPKKRPNFLQLGRELGYLLEKGNVKNDYLKLMGLYMEMK